MAKRPRFSRWRRLPPVFRSGEHRPIPTGNDLDRIIIYLPSRLLDLAEVLAAKAGIPAIRDDRARRHDQTRSVFAGKTVSVEHRPLPVGRHLLGGG